MGLIDVEKYKMALKESSFIVKYGRISQVIGLTIEATGPAVSIGELCSVSASGEKEILAEVVGFRDNKVLLMPLGEMEGISPGSKVTSLGRSFSVGVGAELQGKVINGLGEPIDCNFLPRFKEHYPVLKHAPHPLKRHRITQPLELGVRAIDGLLTIGKGQRVGIFAGSGVGKSTLMGMIARNTTADINVIALVGERGREVREFLEKDLQEEGLQRSVVVVATSDQPALVRLKGAYVATAIAEYYRDQGKDVLLLMDSLTRFAMAQREVGLAVGEPPVSRGYTPSVFSVLPKLLERAGCSEKGSITGLYTVLVDGDDMTEPVTDAARGILDGHIVLSRSMANKNHFPAIDVLSSISRVMPDIITTEHKKIANEIKKVIAVYRESEDLINIGAYVKGSNLKIDYAIDSMENINDFLQQAVEENITFTQTIEQLNDLLI